MEYTLILYVKPIFNDESFDKIAVYPSLRIEEVKDIMENKKTLFGEHMRFYHALLYKGKAVTSSGFNHVSLGQKVEVDAVILDREYVEFPEEDQEVLQELF